MILSFNFGLYPREELRRLSPHLLPIMDGLMEGGHRVERFAIGLKPPPVVNVLTCNRGIGAEAINGVIELKRRSPDLRFGLLFPGPVNDDREPEPADAEGLVRLVGAADFVWSVLPFDTAPEKVARIRYGFSERSIGINTRADAPQPRDIDVMLRGLATPRRQAVADTLIQRGVSCFWMDNASFPPYLTDDLLSRSKMVLDFRQEPEARGRSPALSALALHHGAVIVAESAEPGWQTEFDGLSIVAPYEMLADRCTQIIQSGLYTKLGLAALQKFRAETSMRASMDAALAHTALRRFP